jgi:4-hydroxy-3-methylbut-2-en-1-yl diphosphate reductase
VLCTPLRVEQAALRRAERSIRLVHTGMGPRRAAATAAVLSTGTHPVLVAGVGGGLAPQVRPGDVVVASEVRGGAGDGSSVEVPSAPLLAGALRRLGLTVHVGPICSVSRIARAPAMGDALAVDMESAQLAVPNVPFAVVRAIIDSTDHPLWHVGTLRRGWTALRALRACVPALHWWAAATGPREVLLAGPRSLCADVARVDLVLVIGSAHSSGSLRLVEVAERDGVPVQLVHDLSEIDLRWLAGTTRLGITAGGCSAPHLTAQIVHCLGGLGPVNASQSRLTDEDVTFALPREVI